MKFLILPLVVISLLVVADLSAASTDDDARLEYDLAVTDLRKAGFAGVDVAISRFEKIATTNPKFVDAYLGAADGYILKYEFSKSKDKKWLVRGLKLLDVALGIEPNLPRAYFKRGLLNFNMGDKKTAVTDLRSAMKMDPKYLDPRILYLQYLLSEKIRENPRKFADESLTSFPGDPAPIKYFADVFFQESAWEDAIAYYRLVVDMVEPAPLSYLAMGRALQALSKHDEAITALNTSLSQNPDLAEAHFALGVSLSEKGKIKEAVKQYELFVKRFPKDYSALNNLALLYEEVGQPIKAGLMWLKVKDITTDPSYRERADRRIGVLAQASGQAASGADESAILIAGE